jgi:RimJ/RimL family protein N-acetyltransferase
MERILEKLPGSDCRRIDITIGEKSFWGKKIGTNVIKVLTKFGFEEEGADYIFGCAIADYNPRSQRAFTSAGFRLLEKVKARPGMKAKWELTFIYERSRFR